MGLSRALLGRLHGGIALGHEHQTGEQDEGSHQHKEHTQGQDEPQFSQTFEAGEGKRGKGDCGGQGSINDGRRRPLHGTDHGVAVLFALQGLLFLQAAKPVDAIVNGDSQHEGGKDNGEEVQVAHRQGGGGKGPAQAHHQYQPCHQGASQAA